jgi:transglutaminase-like putative cysteine protease
MTKKLFSKHQPRSAAGDMRRPGMVIASTIFMLLWASGAAAGGEAPQWMHALTSVPLPAHSNKADAVLLYSETNVTVLSADKIRTHVREAYRILRPGGRELGNVYLWTDSRTKITSLSGWCIPTQGKDYQVTEKDAVDQSPMSVRGYQLMFEDVQRRWIRIPAPDPGNIIGYEYEVEKQPFFLQGSWQFQDANPVRESHYSLQLPEGWKYKASWINHAEITPAQSGPNQWQWAVKDVREIEREEDMPPMHGVAGQMVVSFFPPGGAPQHNEFADWDGMGKWYSDLVGERDRTSPPIRQEVAQLTASKVTQVEKMQAIAQFIQSDIRYVAIELGIGGWQPHAAPDIFSHRYGDCKDKATLMISMLREIGIDAYYVIIYYRRDAITHDTPAHQGFNHAIIAIRLPDNLSDASLSATAQHPTLGRILFFDPTDELTPFGSIRGQLQANYGLLVAPSGGELVRLPEEQSALNGIQRTGKLTLDPDGKLAGDILEQRLGDRAQSVRWAFRTATKESDRMKPVETLLADSLGTFQITRNHLTNVDQTNQPLGFDYSFTAPGYAQSTGDMLLVRPRVLGRKSSGLLETDEPRLFAVEFDSASRDSDTFEITLPPGYEVTDLAAPVDADFGFASYHSKTEVNGNVLRYTRTFEVKDLTVPVNKAEELKRLYRIIATDERATVALRKRLEAEHSSASSPQ